MRFTNIKGLLKKTTLFVYSLFALSIASYGINNPINDPITTKKIIETKDHIIVVKNNSVIFDYLLTEEDIESPVQLRVIEQPKFGEVTLNADQTFKYAPLQNLCEKNDEFVYEMTVGSTITKVSVSIDILCENITFMSGMSTQEKAGKLKNFTIHGVENFPNNFLYVFDNTGEEIFHKKNYTNDWDGSLETTSSLEKSKMYYYVFNDGGGNYYSGYLQIN